MKVDVLYERERTFISHLRGEKRDLEIEWGQLEISPQPQQWRNPLLYNITYMYFKIYSPRCLPPYIFIIPQRICICLWHPTDPGVGPQPVLPKRACGHCHFTVTQGKGNWVLGETLSHPANHISPGDWSNTQDMWRQFSLHSLVMDIWKYPFFMTSSKGHQLLWQKFKALTL